MTESEIQNISWAEVVSWLKANPAIVGDADTLVGVARAGVPICVALSYLHPHCRLFFATRKEPRGEKPPVYDFGQEYDFRVKQTRNLFAFPNEITNSKSILVVDDVVTTGATIVGLTKALKEIAPELSVRYIAYAADKGRLERQSPQVLDRLSYAIEIDNSKTWVSFPWNLDPAL